MRRLIIAAAMALLMAMPVAAAKSAPPCVVTPNPVPFGRTFVVEAILVPLKAYDIRIDQSDHFGHHDDASGIYADAAGRWTWTYNLWNDPRDGLTVGVGSIHIKPSSVVARADKGSGGAACSVTVMP